MPDARQFGSTLPGLAGLNQPVYHVDPQETDRALQQLTGIMTPLALTLGGAAVGGPEAMWSLRNLGPAITEAALSPVTQQKPGVYGGWMYPLFHGTTAEFEQFDPGRTKDIGMHFGTLEQAQQRVSRPAPGGMAAYPEQTNIRPAWVDINNPLRLADVFSNRSMTSVLKTLKDSPLKISEKGLKDLTELAMLADADYGRYPQWAAKSTKEFWGIVQNEAIKNGYDGIVYNNAYEGPGDSYIVFDPRKVYPRFGEEQPLVAHDPRAFPGPKPKIPTREESQKTSLLDEITRSLLQLK